MNASEITTLFLPPMECIKDLILLEAAIESWSTKLKMPSSKSCKVAGFQILINAEMTSILDSARFLDPCMIFMYRINGDYFASIIDAISIRKVHIDFELK